MSKVNGWSWGEGLKKIMAWFLHLICFVKLKKENQICKILNNNVEFLQLKNNRKEAMSISLYCIHSFIDEACRLHMYLILGPSLWSNILDHLWIPDTNKPKLKKVKRLRKTNKILTEMDNSMVGRGMDR